MQELFNVAAKGYDNIAMARAQICLEYIKNNIGDDVTLTLNTSNRQFVFKNSDWFIITIPEYYFGLYSLDCPNHICDEIEIPCFKYKLQTLLNRIS